MLKYNPHSKTLARKLRNTPTKAERKLWKHLRKKQINNLQFYRQKPIGKYIVDFYCPKIKLVVELDGDKHFYGKGLVYDKERDFYLKNKCKLQVLRFANNDIYKNITPVLDILWKIALEKN